MSSLTLTAALTYAERGWAVFPLRGKKPWIAERDGGRGYKDATTDKAQIRQWWQKWPAANVGIATGKLSGLFVVDVDPRHSGDATLRELTAKYGAMPETTTVQTGNGGYHLYYGVPANFPISSAASQIGPGIDHRGDGGYVVAPPSIHPDTRRRYEFVKDLGVATAPSWLYELARKRSSTKITGTSASTTEITAYGEAALLAAARNIITAANGSQQATLNSESYGIGRAAGAGLVPSELALRVLIKAAHGMPTNDPRRPWRAGEVEAMVRRAFFQGTKNPRPSAEDVERRVDLLIAESIHEW